MRRSIRDVAADRQRVLFGVDKLERVLFDVANEVLRLALVAGVPDNAHLARLRNVLLEYGDAQKGDWEMGAAPATEASNGTATK